MRSRIWSAPWFRLFLLPVVACAVFSSPIRVVSPFIIVAKHSARSCFLRRNFAAVNKQQTSSPGEIRRVRFLSSQDSSNETALEESLLTSTFFFVSPLTQRQSPPMSTSLSSLQSSPPLRC